MFPVLAHNPELIISLLAGALVLLYVGVPLLYSVLAAVGYMLAGIGCKVVWWRRLLAPAVCMVGCFLLILLLTLFNALQSGYMLQWAAIVVHILMPILIGRVVAALSWWRSALASGIILLLQAALIVIVLWSLSACCDYVSAPAQESVPTRSQVENL